MHLLLSLVTGVVLVAPVAASDVVRTDKGAVRGAVTATGARSFQGIPYAAPPARWSSPRPAARWTGVRDTTRPGAACAQPVGLPIGVPSEAEDCLYLNVTVPAGKRRDRPVIVWIHGGSMMVGTGDLYGPDRLAAGAVVVSMNYRLGVMSFLTHPALDAGSVNGSGSLALEDQQAALRWVRTNISAFGGDPGNVTMMGQSGGGYAVCNHLTAPGSAGLFHRAIIQSAPCTEGSTRTRAEAESDSAGVINAVGCARAADVAACLRSPSVTTAALLAAYDAFGEPRPIAGTPLLPLAPAEAFRTGRFHRVPILIGVNHDEENGMYAGRELTGPPIPAASYEPMVRDQFGPDADAVLGRYPLAEFGGSAGLALATIDTDRNWSVPTFDTARLLARWTRTYVYEFAEQDTPWFAGYPVPSLPWRAQHMSELAYLFDMELFAARTPVQEQLAARMVKTWTAFAGPADPGWRPFTASRPHIQSLRSGRWTAARHFLSDHDYRFWSSLS